MKYKVVIEAEIEYPGKYGQDQSKMPLEQVQRDLEWYIRNRGFERFETYFAENVYSIKVTPVENAAVR